MASRYIPEWIRHAPTPSVRGFAILTTFDSSVRAMLVSVWPLVMYRTLGDAGAVSRVYFWVGVAALALGLMVPWMGRLIPRRWMYTLGISFYLVGPLLAIMGGAIPTALGLAVMSGGTVTIFISLNAYVMDYIARSELGKGETLKLLYSGISWAVGPVLGVWLLKLWEPLPFLIAMGFAVGQGATFWAMRLGNGKLISRARRPAPNPLAYLGRFFAQPRLVAGWLFAVIRSCGWWVYVVYLPIFCIESGLGDQIGGLALSASNAFLLLAPFMLRWMQRNSVRHAVRTGFLAAGTLFLVSTGGLLWPPFAVIALFAASFFLVVLDMCGGLPFLMAVKPSERSEMSAVYSSFRDVSGIITPGVAWLVLLGAPLAGVFAASGAGLLLAWGIAGRLHPRLGGQRMAA
ncbi:MFS transporter [Ostreiculturibacter nitratireducens]|uniref:MFS transporter n=1 Tax=Ostreiculturibacter nitratireducens TaxID=3075226 RepID=UPI0031B60CA4